MGEVSFSVDCAHKTIIIDIIQSVINGSKMLIIKYIQYCTYIINRYFISKVFIHSVLSE